MAFTQFKHSGTLNPEISVCEKKHSSFAEKAAEEGIVLLKNENILPISLSASVALLGIGADKTVKGGIGSGDVNNRQNITIYEGMEESGIRITNRTRTPSRTMAKNTSEKSRSPENPFFTSSVSGGPTHRQEL